MIKRSIAAAFALAALSTTAAHAQCASYPYTLANGATADASQVMANFNCAALTGSPAFSGSVTVGGSESVAGNLGVGTTTPSHLLSLYGTSNYGFLLSITNPTATSYSQLGFIGTGDTYSTGVGNSSENYYGVGNKWYVYDTNSDAMRMVIDSSGNVGIGTTNPQTRLHVAGLVGAEGYRGLQGINGWSFGNDFNFWWDGACVYIYVDVTPFPVTCPSDRRVKNNISGIPEGFGLSTISKLHPVTFSWANTKTTLQPNAQYGFIAQDVQSVLPNLVTNTGMKTPQTPDGMLRVDYNGLIAPIVKAIQDLKTLNDQQAAEIQALQTQFAAYQKAHP